MMSILQPICELESHSRHTRAFPPASNQFGEGVWPIALLTVFHELASGCALLPEIGAMYGPAAVSETELARNGIAKLPANSIVMADAGFGIFGVAYEAKHQEEQRNERLTRKTKERTVRQKRKTTLQVKVSAIGTRG